MRFEIVFYSSQSGVEPVLDFLETLKKTDPDDHAIILAGLDKLRDRKNHREPLSKSLDGGLLELRHVGKLNTRILWCFAAGRKIVLLHGIRNKGRSVPQRDKDTAIKRMKDWKASHP